MSGGLTELAGGLRERRRGVLLEAPVFRQVRKSPAFSRSLDGALRVVHASRTARPSPGRPQALCWRSSKPAYSGWC